MDKKLEVKNLQISFRTQGGILKAVRNISFDLYKGETLAIVGESGSGKSVTSKAIMGILAGNSIVEGGEILYDGQDLLKISEIPLFFSMNNFSPDSFSQSLPPSSSNLVASSGSGVSRQKSGKIEAFFSSSRSA